MSGKNSRLHLNSGVNAVVNVVMGMPTNRLDHLAWGVKAVDIAQLMLEASDLLK